MTSWQPQIEINGKWRGNGYRFATREKALNEAEIRRRPTKLPQPTNRRR
jgi:hypothetical protein